MRPWVTPAMMLERQEPAAPAVGSNAPLSYPVGNDVPIHAPLEQWMLPHNRTGLAVFLAFLLFGVAILVREWRMQSAVSEGSIAGRLVGGVKPVGGTRVILVGNGHSGAPIIRESHLCETASFRFLRLPPSTDYFLHVLDSGSPAVRIGPLNLEPGGTIALAPIALEAPTTITGFVRDKEGHALAEASVARFPSTNSMIEMLRSGRRTPWQQSPAPVDVVDCDASGRFSLSDVRPGSHTLVVEAPGFARAMRRVDARAGPTPGATVDFQLSVAASQDGVLRDSSGQAVAGARVLLRLGDAVDPYYVYRQAEAKTDQSGRFSITSPPRPTGPFVVVVVADGFPVYMLTVDGGGDHEVVLNRSATATLRITSADGNTPIPNASVLFGVSASEGSTVWSEATTTRGGEASLVSCPGRVHTLFVRHPELGPASWAGALGGISGPEMARLASGANRLEFTHLGGTLVEGKVVDREGQGISGAICALVSAFHGLTETVSAGDGTFSMRVPTRDSVRSLVALSPRLVQEIATPHDVQARQVVPWIRMLKPVVVAGRVVDDTGKPVQGALVEAVARGGGPYDPLALVGVKLTTTCLNGWYVIGGIPPRIKLRVATAGDQLSPAFYSSEAGLTPAPDMVLRREQGQSTTIDSATTGPAWQVPEGAQSASAFVRTVKGKPAEVRSQYSGSRFVVYGSFSGLSENLLTGEVVLLLTDELRSLSIPCVLHPDALPAARSLVRGTRVVLSGVCEFRDDRTVLTDCELR